MACQGRDPPKSELFNDPKYQHPQQPSERQNNPPFRPPPQATIALRGWPQPTEVSLPHSPGSGGSLPAPGAAGGGRTGRGVGHSTAPSSPCPRNNRHWLVPFPWPPLGCWGAQIPCANLSPTCACAPQPSSPGDDTCPTTLGTPTAGRCPPSPPQIPPFTCQSPHPGDSPPACALPEHPPTCLRPHPRHICGLL